MPSYRPAAHDLGCDRLNAVPETVHVAGFSFRRFNTGAIGAEACPHSAPIFASFDPRLNDWKMHASCGACSLETWRPLFNEAEALLPYRNGNPAALQPALSNDNRNGNGAGRMPPPRHHPGSNGHHSKVRGISLGELAEQVQGVSWRGDDQFSFQCPGHDDRQASASATRKNGRILLKCFAGCSIERIIEPLGLTTAQLFESSNGEVLRQAARRPGDQVRYPVKEIDGTLAAIHVAEYSDEGKRMWWELPDGRKGLGGRPTSDLPLFGIERIPPDADEVIVCEGEKAAAALQRRGLAAVGTVTGASSCPSDKVWTALMGRELVLWPDNDDQGRKHMAAAAGHLGALGIHHRMIDWADAPPKGDAADFEGSNEEIGGLIAASALALSTRNGHIALASAAREVIVCEDYDTAVAANEEYLKRKPIIDRLFYSQTISLFVGGKHHGKSTAARTSAMCVMRGLPFLGRAVQQGPVLYCASGDEVPVARMELLRMGWDSRKDPLRLVHIKPGIDDADEVLGQIGDLALKDGAVYIVADMLFDFAPIRDEMSYAGTRAAIGKIQALADRTLASVAPTHHSPKYMGDAATAGQAALGSQGIAARFSPIVLSRKWAEGLFSISSTTTRDPRGAALIETCIETNALGWTQSAGEFKSWMKWKVYAARVIALFEGDEPGKELSVDAVARGLDISRPDAQNALYRLWKDRQLDREKKGHGYRYWLPTQNQEILKQTDEAFESNLPGESHE